METVQYAEFFYFFVQVYMVLFYLEYINSLILDFFHLTFSAGVRSNGDHWTAFSNALKLCGRFIAIKTRVDVQ